MNRHSKGGDIARSVFDLGQIGSLLIVAAHHDDEAIGCGGTIARLSKKLGVEIGVVFVTDGATGVDNSGSWESNEIVDVRLRESERAAKVLGISFLENLNEPAQRVSSESQKVFHRLINIIRTRKPDLVITHTGGDRHRDHRACNALVVEACWKSWESIHPELGEVHRVQDVWSMEISDLHDEVDFVVEIDTLELEKKLSALDEYKSQQALTEHISGMVRGLAAVRGRMIGVPLGEGFKRISRLPVAL